MKKIKYYIIALFVVGMAASCTDWLTVYPNNEQTTDQYWRNKEEVEAVLTSSYAMLRSNATSEKLFLWGEARGNGVKSNQGGNSDFERFASSDILPTNKFVSWTELYRVINVANTVIEYAPTVLAKDKSYNEAAMKSQLAEAYFLRSLCYFYLVRMFGEVPFPTEPYVTDDNDFMIAKSSEDVILKHILADLYASLPAAKEVFEEKNPSGPQYRTKGRATKWAIYALIADINLWMGNYDDCIAACDAITNSGKVALVTAQMPYSAEGQYRDKLRVWFSNYYPGNTNESIFELQYTNSDVYNDPNLFLTNAFVNGNWYYASYHTMSLFGYGEGQLIADARRYSLNGDQICKYLYINIDAAKRGTKDNDQNWIIYRVAEIYLMKAEALIMKASGNVENYKAAEALINQVRNRADAAPIVPQYDEVAMLNFILTERQLEFLAEGKNWFDILRIAKRDNYKHKDMLFQQIGLRNMIGSGSAGVVSSKLSDVNSWYLPIHSDELKRNSLLVQNPFYKNLGK